MSRFLGMIHYLMYGKIQFQEEMVQELARLGEEHQVFQVKEVLDDLGSVAHGELGEVIDTDNIHRWLADQVDLVERRLAGAVHQLERDGNIEPSTIYERMKEVGRRHPLSGEPAEIFQQLNTLLLDGMPCDRAVAPVPGDEEAIQVITDVHRPYWDNSGKIGYWDLRSQVVSGLLDNSGYEWEQEDGLRFRLRKR